MTAVLIIATILVVAVGIPTITDYIYKNAKDKRGHEIEKLKYQKELMELEIQKGNMDIKFLEEENRKLDKIINEN
ncbi:hypothetical protein FACS1894141_2570 [Spirochaetia bacterium]|nr:hypothetical protein FACS1894141_2570 [Spirochaetia bacterium]